MVQRSFYIISGLAIGALLGMAQAQPAMGSPPGASADPQDAIKSLKQSIDDRDTGSSVARAEAVRGQLLGPFTPDEIAAAQNQEDENFRAAILAIFLEYEGKAPAAGTPTRARYLAQLTYLSWLAGQYEKTKIYANESIAIGGSGACQHV